MAEPSQPEPVETVRGGYLEAQPASEEDVDRAREQDEVLNASATGESDRSLTGQTRPVDHEEAGSTGGGQNRP